MADSVVKQGSVDIKVLGKKGTPNDDQWRRKFCVLHKRTPGRLASIVWYADLLSFLENHSTYQGVYFEDITEAGQMGVDQLYVKTKKGLSSSYKVLFKASSPSECSDWLRCIDNVLTTHAQPTGQIPDVADYATLAPASSGAVSTFDVTVLPTEKAEACGLGARAQCQLKLYDQHLVVAQRTTGHLLVKWPYSVLRRYGIRSNNILIIETGRLASTGDGMFQFQTPRAQDILTTIKGRLKALKEFGEGEYLTTSYATA